MPFLKISSSQYSVSEHSLRDISSLLTKPVLVVGHFVFILFFVDMLLRNSICFRYAQTRYMLALLCVICALCARGTPSPYVAQATYHEREAFYITTPQVSISRAIRRYITSLCLTASDKRHFQRVPFSGTYQPYKRCLCRIRRRKNASRPLQG